MRHSEERIVLTGFMGVGKSTVARHLARLTGRKRIDLDDFVERASGKRIPEILNESGIGKFRELETAGLKRVLSETDAAIVSLGGGAWTSERNRRLIKEHGMTAVWLETTFEHCWRNIRASKKERPLVKNRLQALRLFEEREKYYCLADWHFLIEPGQNSYEVACRIASDVFSVRIS